MIDKMIVLADLGRVKAYRVSHDAMTSKPQVELVYDCEFLEAHGRMTDKVSDQAGRYSVSHLNGASTSENHNLLGETERRLIRMVAGKINDLAQGQQCWCLAAGEGINSRIVEQLRADNRATLLKNVSADLVKTPKQQIMDYFTVEVARI